MTASVFRRSISCEHAGRLVGSVFLLFAMVPCIWAQPAITAVKNAAGNLKPGLPNAGIAQGAIFIVQGSGLGPANISIAQPAFQATTLSGTSVAVTVNGTQVNALMYYTSDGQVAAVLPSNTPTGTGTISVTYNGTPSPTAPITVVANNLGVFSIDSSGQGPAIVTYSDYSLVSPDTAANCGGPNTTCGAANPGDTLILWGTGLGPVNGSDAAGAGLGVNMPNIPLTVWLGGVEAPVIYQGRSGCCVGEDQIVFTVPNNVPAACAVPLQIQIGNQISNSTVLPVATGSRNCTPANPVFAAAKLQQLVNTGPINIAVLDMDNWIDGMDRAQFGFGQIQTYEPGTQPFFASFIDDQPIGTCAVYPNQTHGGNDIPFVNVGALDAGANLTLKGPNGSVMVPTSLLYHTHTDIGAPGSLLVPGSFTITGTGGANIGAFTANFNILTLPKLTSPAANAVITRANGLTVNWTGGDPSANVLIEITGNASNGSFATAACSAPASAGTLAIPSYTLLALPQDNHPSFGLLSAPTDTSFTATGLSIGLISTFLLNESLSVTLQ